MVTSVTSFGRNGVSDWLLQRASAVVMLAYTLFLVGYLVLNPGLTFADWDALFNQTCVRVFSLLALLSLAMHAWIGLWSVSTDYMTERMMGTKGNVLRGLFQAASALVLFTYVVWVIEILWG